MKIKRNKFGCFEKGTLIKISEYENAPINSLSFGDVIASGDGSRTYVVDIFTGFDIHYKVVLDDGNFFVANSYKVLRLKKTLDERFYGHLPEIYHANILDVRRKIAKSKSFAKTFKIPSCNNSNAKILRIDVAGIREYFGISTNGDSTYILGSGAIVC